MIAIKGNKTYSIDATQRKHYKESGFDILDDDGEVLDYGRGKTVPYDDYAKLKESHERLVTAYEDLEFRYAQLVHATDPEAPPEPESEHPPESEQPEQETKKGKAASKKAGE